MAEYDEKLDVPIAFPAESFENTLGEVLSKHNKKQLRIAETEKYAHVTFSSSMAAWKSRMLERTDVSYHHQMLPPMTLNLK